MDQKQREKVEGEMPYGGFGSGMGGPPPGCLRYFTWTVVVLLLIAAWFLLR